jgi:hypothetical protein
LFYTYLLSLVAAPSPVLLAETVFSPAIPASEVELPEANDFSGSPVAAGTPLVPDLDKLSFPEALELPTEEEELPLLPGFPPLLLPFPALLLPMPEPPRLPLIPRTGDAIVEAVAMPFSPVPEVVVPAVLAMLETVEDGVELLLLEVVNPPTVVAGLTPAVADVVEDKEL